MNWIMAARPKTLTAAIIPIIAATALVHFKKLPIDMTISVLCLVSSLAIQVATNFINDLIDFEKGADTHERLGPKRVTQSLLIGRRTMCFGIGICLLIALISGLPLVIAGGWPIVSIGLLSLFLAYSYTGGPFPLAYLGLGDIFVILFFGLIAVGGVFFLQTGYVDLDTMVLGLQIGMLSAVLIAINNLRDIEQDRKAAKKTIPVRMGITFARREIYLLLFAPFLLQIYWLNSGGLGWSLPLIALPLAIYIAVQVSRNNPSPIYNQFLAQSALLHGGFGLLLSVGLNIV